jgi:hypothetical protein
VIEMWARVLAIRQRRDMPSSERMCIQTVLEEELGLFDRPEKEVNITYTKRYRREYSPCLSVRSEHAGLAPERWEVPLARR